jgi:hypothetical protein
VITVVQHAHIEYEKLIEQRPKRRCSINAPRLGCDHTDKHLSLCGIFPATKASPDPRADCTFCLQGQLRRRVETLQVRNHEEGSHAVAREPPRGLGDWTAKRRSQARGLAWLIKPMRVTLSNAFVFGGFWRCASRADRRST